MRRRAPSRRLRASAAALAAAVVLACGPPAPEAARDRALRFFETRVPRADPSWAAIFGHLHRRFGLEARSASGAPLHLPGPVAERPEVAAVYRRLFDPAATVAAERIAALPSAVDRMTALALHCDRVAPPPDFADALRRATELGGYALTHAALAGQWTLENGCAGFGDLRALQAAQVERLAALAGDREGVGAGHEAGYDVWIEALAMLHYVGAGSRVRPEWLAQLLGAQRADGGWSRSPGEDRSDPHATALALWVLLETLEPDAPPTPFVPSAR
jgi:hypothetical protein